MKDQAKEIIKNKQLVKASENKYTYKHFNGSVGRIDTNAKTCSCPKFADKAVCKHLVAACILDNARLFGLEVFPRQLKVMRKRKIKRYLDDSGRQENEPPTVEPPPTEPAVELPPFEPAEPAVVTETSKRNDLPRNAKAVGQAKTQVQKNSKDQPRNAKAKTQAKSQAKTQAKTQVQKNSKAQTSQSQGARRGRPPKVAKALVNDDEN